jgi:fluoride ion exporter CrcB/FEX
VTDVDGGRPGRALAYLAVSVAGGIAAAAAGCALGRRLA